MNPIKVGIHAMLDASTIIAVFLVVAHIQE